MPSIAVVGASPDRKKFGNKCVRAYARAGYTVFPVHPTASEVEGLPAYRSVAAVPAAELDRVSVYLPPAVGVTVMSEIAKKPVGEVWLNPGSDAPAVASAAEKLGLTVVRACSILDLGLTPAMFPDE